MRPFLDHPERQSCRIRLVGLSAMEPRFADAPADDLGRLLRALAGDVLALYVASTRQERDRRAEEARGTLDEALELVRRG